MKFIEIENVTSTTPEGKPQTTLVTLSLDSIEGLYPVNNSRKTYKTVLTLKNKSGKLYLLEKYEDIQKRIVLLSYATNTVISFIN